MSSPGSVADCFEAELYSRFSENCLCDEISFIYVCVSIVELRFVTYSFMLPFSEAFLLKFERNSNCVRVSEHVFVAIMRVMHIPDVGCVTYTVCFLILFHSKPECQIELLSYWVLRRVAVCIDNFFGNCRRSEIELLPLAAVCLVEGCRLVL